MDKLLIKCFNLATVLMFLPCLAGCNESASGSAISDVVSTAGSGSDALIAPISDGSALHTPEPATILMVGTGILALRFLSRHSR